MIIELRVNYPNSIWGKIKTVLHKLRRCNLNVEPCSTGGVVVYDDTCLIAWWA